MSLYKKHSLCLYILISFPWTRFVQVVCYHVQSLKERGWAISQTQLVNLKTLPAFSSFLLLHHLFNFFLSESGCKDKKTILNLQTKTEIYFSAAVLFNKSIKRWWIKNPILSIKYGINNKLATTYSPTFYCSTIGATGLNFSVRDGKRWTPML